jgi:hypothetical protein
MMEVVSAVEAFEGEHDAESTERSSSHVECTIVVYRIDENEAARLGERLETAHEPASVYDVLNRHERHDD